MTKVSLARICGLMSGRPDIQDPRSLEKERRWRMKREGIEGMKMEWDQGMVWESYVFLLGYLFTSDSFDRQVDHRG